MDNEIAANAAQKQRGRPFKKGESGNAERIIKFPIKTEEKREYHNNFKKEKIANAVKS